MKLETTILARLITDEDFLRKVLPFLKPEYFTDRHDKIVFNQVKDFVTKYNTAPSLEALNLSLQDVKSLTDDDMTSLGQVLTDINAGKDTEINQEWLIDRTEEFCKDKAVYNAVKDSITILEGKNKTHEKGLIPQLLADALAVSFDNSVGHDYLEDYNARYDFYHRVEERLPFDLEQFNKITKGGLPRKSLTIAMAGTGVGKSLFMCHVAAAALWQGKNVLYITLEMAEEQIAERIDANLMNIKVDDIAELPRDVYEKRISKFQEKTKGKLIIKEYPTTSASVIHFRSLLNELFLKKSMKPDIVFIDYLNICASSRLKPGGAVNSYSYVKSIAEEVRGLAVEFKVPVVSATQLNRAGFSDSDPGLEDTSESFGLPMTADFMFALISSEDLEQLGQIMVKQLKNRWYNPTNLKRFVIGIDKAKMKLYDVEQSAQIDIVDAGNAPAPTIKVNKMPKNKPFPKPQPKKGFDQWKFEE